MKEVIINEMELFRNMAEITLLDNIHIDLHNDYSCKKITYEETGKEFSLFFQKDDSLDTSAFVVVKFKDASLNKIELDFSKSMHNLTLDNMYRGRFQENGNLVEYTFDKKAYFYIDFVENITVELFAKEIVILSE